MVKTRGDLLDTSDGQVVGKSQGYALLVDASGNAILDAGGNEQITELQAVGGRLKVDASITGSLSSLQSLGVSVASSTVAVRLTTGLVASATQLVIYAPDAGKIYWGSTQASLATNGLPLSAGDAPQVFNFAAAGGFPIYAVSDGTARIVRVGESK